ncbi:MAG: hypothetical protein L6300_06075 [Syntrophaceae bacterium]|nr:hypothetical protein [Syntrophaceae bacterium]
MTGIITLVDEGQNYVTFYIECDIIVEVQPSMKAGWEGTKILNKEFVIGGMLWIELQWDDYDLPLKHLIAKINEEAPYGSEWLLANMSTDKIFYEHYITIKDHWAYTVDCKGIPFWFDCLNTQAIAAANALLNTDKIPAALLDVIDQVQLVYEPLPLFPDAVAGMIYGTMTIYKNHMATEGLIAHEAAHTFAVYKWGTVMPAENSDYMAAINSGEPVVSEYSKKHIGEDFAEAVQMYVTGPGYLKKIAPLRYDVIHRLMTDPGYSG